MNHYCFVHAADLHLDTPFEGLRRGNPGVHARLVDASLEAWDALVELVLERDARFLLLAGDLYDGAERGLRAQLRFRRGLEKLSNAGVSVFVVHGNHDPVEEGWSAIRDWPEGVTIFPSEHVESAGVEVGGRRIATVHGRSYARRETRENLALGYHRGGEPGLHIGLLHCNVGNVGASAGHANYSPCSLDDLIRARMDYWALGHVHVHSVLRRADPWVVYPGNLQGRSPQPGECGAKGAVVVEVSGDRVDSVEHVALDRVRFVVAELDAASCRDLAALESELAGLAESQRAGCDGRGLLLRVRLVGRSELRSDLDRQESIAELLAALRDRFDGASPLLWWDSLESHLRPPLDRESVRQRDDFSSELLGMSEALARDPEAAARFLAARLDSLPPRQRGVALPSLAASEHADILQRAEDLALELLHDAASESA